MAENNKNTTKQDQYDMYIIEKPEGTGINAEEIFKTLRDLKSIDVYPVEIPCPKSKSRALGFVTVDAARRLNYKYREKSRIGIFLRLLMADMDPADKDKTFDYEFEEISKCWKLKRIKVRFRLFKKDFCVMYCLSFVSFLN